MITIVFSDRISIGRQPFHFTQELIGTPDKFTIRKIDESNIHSGDVLLMTYNSLTIQNFEFFESLRGLVLTKGVRKGVSVYDHEQKIRKSFWPDEEEEGWVEFKKQDVPDFMKD